MRSAAIITAAGFGSRMGAGKNKVLLPFNDHTVIEAAIKSFTNPEKIQKIIITHNLEDKEILITLFKGIPVPLVFVQGGSTRQESVFNGLKALLDDNPETVLIHDAARPWITEKLVEKVLLKVEEKGSALPVIPSVNAMKKIDDSGRIIEHLQRKKTVSAQTPQGFNYKKILQAHRMAKKEGYTAIDDAELWDKYFNRVSTVTGNISNTKITYKKDLEKL